MESLFKNHLYQILTTFFDVMERLNIDQVFIDAGSPTYYFTDDQYSPFRINPFFNYFCPATGTGHALLINRGQTKPVLFFNQPKDFWHEVPYLEKNFWLDCFEMERIESNSEAWISPRLKPGCEVITPHSTNIQSNNDLNVARAEIISGLNWLRGQKTEYEFTCLKEASRKASYGHKAVEKLFYSSSTELNLYNNYLIHSEQRENDAPYGSIVGMGSNSAILHYQNPKPDICEPTLLIDAGAKHFGYCSDITRTYYLDSVHEVFKSLHSEVLHIQNRCIGLLKPGVSYIKVQKLASELTVKALIKLQILTCSFEEAMENAYYYPFFPHGIGHPIGLLVHDVGAKVTGPIGTPINQPKDFPHLRTLRDVLENDYLTIEPGIYFIPSLLNEWKENRQFKKSINWDLVEQLLPLGGIRIEDNLFIKKDETINLTRLFL